LHTDKYKDGIVKILLLVRWSYIVTCDNCGYISAEKLPEEKAKEILHSHVGGPRQCTTGHIRLMKVRS
jgi:hypothetical protein